MDILPFLTGASPLNHSTLQPTISSINLLDSLRQASIHITSLWRVVLDRFGRHVLNLLLALLWVISGSPPICVILCHVSLLLLNLLLALPGFVSPQSRDTLSRLWVRLPPFPTSSSQKSSVLSLSRWHRSTLSQRSSWSFAKASLCLEQSTLLPLSCRTPHAVSH